MHHDATVQSESLTPSLNLSCDWRDHDQYKLITRFVFALRLCLKRLVQYYLDLAKEKDPQEIASNSIYNSKFRAPYPHQYTSLDNQQTVQFCYVRALFSSRLIFEVERLDDKKRVVVKFVETYCTDAHKSLSAGNVAPELLGYDELPGGWLMITMEYLSDGWTMLESLSMDERQLYKAKVEEALNMLHNAGYVHGDVRACNILVRGPTDECEDIKIKLLDFDESGPPETTKYPPYWNSKTVTRHEEAVEGAPLQKAHDEFMVTEIFKGVAHVSGHGKRVKVA